jgi:hypothetical protein
MGDGAGSWYASPGPLTDLTRHAGRLRSAPRDPAGVARFVQGLVLHPFHAWRYGVSPQALRSDDLQVRGAAEMLDRVLALDASDLAEPRPPERRFVGNCRHFSTLATALLRHHEVPARARCGFGSYFEPGKLVDHWVCETWEAKRGRFIAFDPQLDEVQRKGMGIAFDVLDLPTGAFVSGGDAWRRCRSGELDPKTCGILDMWGLWFVLGNLVRDVASLAKVELLPWDGWGLMRTEVDTLTPDDWALLDRAAKLADADDPSLALLRALYASEPGLRVPRAITSWVEGMPAAVDLGFDA